ncbi:hypothetical protein HRbin15_01344 [bacterium HR15]|nr:hypothetical protein HRbin15_01344 [bacterium HR15]
MSAVHEATIVHGDVHQEPVINRPHPPTRVYLVVWGWLFVLSFGAYLVELISEATTLALPIKWSLLTVIGLMKAGLIVAYFMHMRFERLSLIYAILLPTLLVIALVAGLMPDAVSLISFWGHP